jgi:hypothetical protein
MPSMPLSARHKAITPPPSPWRPARSRARAAAGIRATRLVSFAAATALCVPACSGADAAAVVRLGPDDSGKTVVLAVGDRLQVILSGGRLTGGWALASYPRPTLAPGPGAVPVGGVGLVAREAGSGQVVLVRVLCGPPVDPPTCPGGSGVGPGQTSPTRWTVMVTVH